MCAGPSPTPTHGQPVIPNTTKPLLLNATTLWRGLSWSLQGFSTARTVLLDESNIKMANLHR